MNFFTSNLAESLFIIGLILLVVEVVVLGFSTFVLFFVGLAAMVTGGLLYVDLLPNNELESMLSTGILTLIFAVILWRPLKRMQSDVSQKKVQSDLVGYEFILKESVSLTESPKHHYSGVDWSLISTVPIEAGTRVEVVEAEVGAFHIKAIIN